MLARCCHLQYTFRSVQHHPVAGGGGWFRRSRAQSAGGGARRGHASLVRTRFAGAPSRASKRSFLPMSLTLDIARRALDASRARARELGCQVSIALVDSAGHLVAFERMMAPYAWATSGIAEAKATSAVMFNQSTTDISGWANSIPGFATSMATQTHGKFIMAPGGWPIRGPNGVTV